MSCFLIHECQTFSISYWTISDVQQLVHSLQPFCKRGKAGFQTWLSSEEIVSEILVGGGQKKEILCSVGGTYWGWSIFSMSP